MIVGKGAKVFIADRDIKGAETFAKELNKNGQAAWAVEVDVADWESQLKGFEAVVKEVSRIDYVYPVAGIGERFWLPNRPNATGFTKPDLTVMDVDANRGSVYIRVGYPAVPPPAAEHTWVSREDYVQPE